MRRLPLIYLLSACLFATILTGVSQPEEGPAIVSLMIDADVLAAPTEEEVDIAQANLANVYRQIKKKDLTATLFLTQDISNGARLQLAQFPLFSTIEFAMSGKTTDDELSSMSYSEQVSRLELSKIAAEATSICDVTEVEVKGFMPPSFDQNEDTFKALDEIGIEYNAGFQEGVIYTTGHEGDIWPYQVDGHNFYAVPISTVEISGELLPLYDRYMYERGLSSTEWYEMLVDQLDESAANGEPMVVLLTISVSGTDSYLDTLEQFLDYAESNNAIFVNGGDLVTIVKTGKLTLSEGRQYQCTTCGQDGSSDISITRVDEPEQSEVAE